MKPEYIIDFQLFEPFQELKPYIKYCIYVHFKNKGQNIWFPADLRNQLLYLQKGKAVLERENRLNYQSEISLRGIFTVPLNVRFESPEIQVFTIEFTETAFYNLFQLEGEKCLNKIDDFNHLLPHIDFTAPGKDFSPSEINKYFQNQLIEFKKNAKTEKSASFDNAIEISKQNHGKITVEKLSEKTAIHTRTLNRYFKKYTGISPKKYLHQINVRHLLSELLMKERTKGSNLAEKYGLYDESHLIRVIKKYTGTSPKKIEDFDTSWFEFIRDNDNRLS